jgi:hypothetical protein
MTAAGADGEQRALQQARPVKQRHAYSISCRPLTASHCKNACITACRVMPHGTNVVYGRYAPAPGQCQLCGCEPVLLSHLDILLSGGARTALVVALHVACSSTAQQMELSSPGEMRCWATAAWLAAAAAATNSYCTKLTRSLSPCPHTSGLVYPGAAEGLGVAHSLTPTLIYWLCCAAAGKGTLFHWQ